MNNKTKAKVIILGNNYTIVGDESEEYIKSIAAQADEKMKEISQKTNLRPMAASVLAAVNFCYEFCKSQEELKNCRLELEKCHDEIKTLEHERKFLKDEIKALRGKI